MPCCVWRARGGMHAVITAQCAVVAAVQDVVLACGGCVFVCCVRVCDVACVACRRALFWVTRAMTLTCRCAGWGLSRRVCLRACVWCDGVGERGASRHVREVCIWACENVKNGGCVILATYDARIAVAVSSAVGRALYHSIAIAALCRCVCVDAPRFAVAAVLRCSAAWHRFSGGLLVFVRLGSLRARARNRGVAVRGCCACVVGGGGGGDRWQSVLRTTATRVV